MESIERARLQEMLGAILRAQPGLLAAMTVSPKAGENLAEFAHAFIRKYSELANQDGPSPP